MKAKVKVTLTYGAAEMGTMMHALRHGATPASMELADKTDRAVQDAANSVADAHRTTTRPVKNSI